MAWRVRDVWSDHCDSDTKRTVCWLCDSNLPFENGTWKCRKRSNLYAANYFTNQSYCLNLFFFFSFVLISYVWSRLWTYTYSDCVGKRIIITLRKCFLFKWLVLFVSYIEVNHCKRVYQAISNFYIFLIIYKCNLVLHAVLDFSRIKQKKNVKSSNSISPCGQIMECLNIRQLFSLSRDVYVLIVLVILDH